MMTAIKVHKSNIKGSTVVQWHIHKLAPVKHILTISLLIVLLIALKKFVSKLKHKVDKKPKTGQYQSISLNSTSRAKCLGDSLILLNPQIDLTIF